MVKPIIAIINGPNLNLLGKRQVEIYGDLSFDEYMVCLRKKYSSVFLSYHQSNHEGDLIDLIHQYGFNSAGIVLNAGAYTHTSIAIADAISSITSPVAEVHITDIYHRESYRHHSYLTEKCVYSIVGQGLMGYDMAVDVLLSKLVL